MAPTTSSMSSTQLLSPTPGGGLDENYLSLEDVLMTATKVPVTFHTKILYHGYFDPCTASEHIEIGDKIDIPLWLAKMMSSKNFCRVDYTRQYKSAHREILAADAEVVNLNKLGPFFYNFGYQLLNFRHSNAPKLASCLLNSFKSRLNPILNISRNQLVGEKRKFSKKLDFTEKWLFDLGQETMRSLEQWKNGSCRMIETSQLVLRQQKRKIDQAK